MIAAERDYFILNRLQDKGTVTIKETALELAVSEATVRRDFERLERQGLVSRVRAGATRIDALPLGNVAPQITSEKITEHMDEKLLIAQKAASLIQDGECIFLDGGTTVAPIIDYIQGKNVKIVTHNLLVPQRLKDVDADIFLIGGHYKHYHESTVGIYSEKMISQFHFDYAFFGCSGIELTRQLAYNDDIETVPAKEVAMKCADKNYLLADSRKIGKTSFCRFSALQVFDGIICCAPENLAFSLPSNFIVVNR